MQSNRKLDRRAHRHAIRSQIGQTGTQTCNQIANWTETGTQTCNQITNWTDGYTDMQSDRKLDRDGQTDMQSDHKLDRRAHRHAIRSQIGQTGTQTHNQITNWTDGHTDMQSDRKLDRDGQTDKTDEGGRHEQEPVGTKRKLPDDARHKTRGGKCMAMPDINFNPGGWAGVWQCQTKPRRGLQAVTQCHVSGEMKTPKAE